MKTSLKFGVLSLFFASGTASLIGCTYEAPQASMTVGAGGNNASSSSGEGGSSGQSTGGSGGQGGAGGGTCNPKDVMFCSIYTGPPETENKGVCTASISTCSQSGSWLDCEAEVLPKVETCNSTDDVNCDGLGPCLGAPLAIEPPSGSLTGDGDFILAMAVSPGSPGKDGNVYAVGGKGGSAGDPPNNLRVLVWQRDAAGTIHDWSNNFQFTAIGNTNGAVATGVAAVPGSSDVIVTGVFAAGTLKIGSFPEVTTTLPITFLTRFDASGQIVNSRMVNVSGRLNTRAIAIDPMGNIYIAGSQSDAPTIDGVTFPFFSATKGFIVGLTPEGNYKWHHAFTNGGTHEVSKITLLDNNTLITTTEFIGPLTYKISASLTETVYGGGEPDILVNRLRAADGFSQWKAQLVGTGATSPRVQVGGLTARNGLVAIGGTFRGGINIDGKLFEMTDPMDPADAFLATIDGETGNVVTKMASQALGVQDVQALAFDSNGDLVIGGSFSGSLPFPGDTLTTTLGIDAFVIKTDNTFKTKWTRHFGDASDQVVQALVVGKNAGNIYAGGAFQGKLQGVNPLLTSTGYFDAFLMQLSN